MYENLIVVCYAAGAMGNAIGRVIELSPSIYDRNPNPERSVPDEYGTMHLADRRFGLWHDSKEQLTMELFAQLQGFKYNADKDLSGKAQAWRDYMDQLRLSRYDSTPLMQGLTTHKIVAADHIRAEQAKQLMPDCKTVAVTGDPEIALRLFWAKWTQLPAPKWHRWHAQHPNVPIIDLEIAEYENCPIKAVTDDMRARDWQYNLQRTEKFHQHHRTDDSDYRLDFLTLFQPTTSKTVYHDMMDALGLEPNWPAVNSFIETYMAAQPRHLI